MARKNSSFIVSGRIKKGKETNFSIEIQATSEKHASALARSKLAGKHRLRLTSLQINEVKKK